MCCRDIERFIGRLKIGFRPFDSGHQDRRVLKFLRENFDFEIGATNPPSDGLIAETVTGCRINTVL